MPAFVIILIRTELTGQKDGDPIQRELEGFKLIARIRMYLRNNGILRCPSRLTRGQEHVVLSYSRRIFRPELLDETCNVRRQNSNSGTRRATRQSEIQTKCKVPGSIRITFPHNNKNCKIPGIWVTCTIDILLDVFWAEWQCHQFHEGAHHLRQPSQNHDKDT